MKVHLYTLCWNEVDILGFFFRHYDKFVDRYVVYDDGSTDGSIELLRSHPRVELRRFERSSPNSFVLSQQTLQNEVWKESRGKADWVIITALDEHLMVPSGHVGRYLEYCRRQEVTLIPSIGYQMISEAFPKHHECLAQTLLWGAPYGIMNKLAIFNPDKIIETGFTVGRHSALPVGEIVYPERDLLMLLHYKYLEFNRTLFRHRAQSLGLGAKDKENSWGGQYLWSLERFREEWDRFASKAIYLGERNFDPSADNHFEAPIWWSDGPRASEKLWCRILDKFGLILGGK